MDSYLHNTGSFSGKKGNEIFFQRWDVRSPKAILVVVHGLGEHSGRYTHLLETLKGKRISLFSFDMRGHGKSEGKRGHIDGFSDYLYDLKLFLNLIREEYQKKPLILLGHSMGAVITLKYALEYPNDISALVVSSASVVPALFISKWKLVIVDFVSKYFPSFLFASGIKAEDLTHDSEAIDIFENDPLVHYKVSARLYTELIRINKEILKEAHQIKCPLLIIHGKVDKIADHQGSELVFKKASSGIKNIVVFENLYHEIMNETEDERSKVLSTISKWIDKVTAKLKAAGSSEPEKAPAKSASVEQKPAPKKAASKKAVKKAPKKAAKKTVKKAAKKTAKKVTKKAPKKAAKKTPKKAVKKAPKKAVKKTTKKKK